MPTLTWWPEGGKRVVHQITKSITTIGSKPANDIAIADKGLLDHHAMLVFDGREFSLSSPDGKGEIGINGKKRRKAKLAHDDRLTMGETEFIFNILGAPEPKPDLTGNGFSAQIEGLRKLQQFSSLLLRSESVSQLLEELMDAVIDLTGAAKGFLVLFEEGVPCVKVARNLRRENIGGAVAELSDSIVARVVETQEAIIVSDAQNDTMFRSAASVINFKLSSVMCAPLMERGKLLGLIYVGNDSITGLFERSMLELLEVFATQASLLVRNALLVDDLKLQNVNLSNELKQQRFGEIIGSSATMKQVFNRVEKVASTEVSVLIGGETGTGKELIAREIHRRSARAGGPFVTINCGAIPETLMESEFFGHVRGAFTGAAETKMGKFQAADKGTIFLDEIGEMPLNLQVKLLRVLQERQVVKVGATKPETLDIRVLAATNRDLEQEIAVGAFREDLYYRLNVVTVHLPPLRDREADVTLLARYLLKRYTDEFGASAKGFTPGALIALKRHDWPGNVRELENRLKKAIILCEGTMIGPGDLDLSEDRLPEILSLSDARERFQRQYVIDVLDRNGGNRAKTARDLDVDPRTIYRYLEKT